MTTLAVLKALIADDLNRSDLTSQIEARIDRAVNKYKRKPFWFLHQTNSISLIAGDASKAVPTGLVWETDVRIEEGSQEYEMQKMRYGDIKRLQTAGVANGIPAYYGTQGSTFHFFPEANRAFTVYVDGFYEETDWADDSATNAWSNEAQDLIAAETKYTIARDILRDEKRLATESLARQEALSDLIAETNHRLGTKRIPPRL